MSQSSINEDPTDTVLASTMTREMAEDYQWISERELGDVSEALCDVRDRSQLDVPRSCCYKAYTFSREWSKEGNPFNICTHSRKQYHMSSSFRRSIRASPQWSQLRSPQSSLLNDGSTNRFPFDYSSPEQARISPGIHKQQLHVQLKSSGDPSFTNVCSRLVRVSLSPIH